MGGQSSRKKRARTFRSIIAKQQPVVECIVDHTMAHQSTTAEVDSFLSSKPLLLPLLALLRGAAAAVAAARAVAGAVVW